MLRPNETLEIGVEAGASACLDEAAAAAPEVHAFLRAAWFAAGAGAAPLATLTARRAAGDVVAAIPLVERRLGPLALREVPGSYWPYRSFPVAGGASDGELAALLASAEGSAALGRAWRLGPIYADDPTGARLAEVAGRAGWTVLTRRLGTCHVVDLARLTAAGPWPSVKTLRKNRWLERRLGEAGELAFRSVSGADWNGEVLDTLAAIEAESWVGASGGDAKFARPANRRIWERAIEDPVLAAKLRCALLHVGGTPAAFAFSLEAGPTRYYIANSYSARFADRSPGRILLYRDFQQAAEAGIATISWGAGDPGYKSEMGAQPGPAILDLLIVRGRLRAALARPFWRAGG